MAAPARLTLTPVRGYAGVTDRISGAITNVPGITAARGGRVVDFGHRTEFDRDQLAANDS